MAVFKELISLLKSKRCGASAVKFQTFSVDKLVSFNTPLATHHKNIKSKISHYDLIKKLELKNDDFRNLKKYTKSLGKKFISPYDNSLKFLIKLKCDFIKIASSELVNLPLLDIVRKSNILIILSTGMSTLEEIKQSINFILQK